MPSRRLLALGLALSLALAACSPLARLEQPRRTEQYPLGEGLSLGQTFVARYDGLQGAALYLKPQRAGDGQLRLRLQGAPGDGEELALAQLPLSQVDEPGYYRFLFPPIERSGGEDYSLSLELVGGGSVEVGAGPANAYLNGALYRDGQPQEAQLAFRLFYDPARLALGLAAEGLRWLGLLALAAGLFVLPGWAALASLWPGWRRLTFWEKAGLAAGTGFALYPLLFLWSDLAGLRLGALFAWLPLLAGLAWAGWRLQRRVRRGERPAVEGRGAPALLADLAFLAVLALIALTRFWPVRSLEVPMWGDSYTHTLVAQLLVEQGGLFRSWEPYAGMQSFTYHFGFHAQAAALHWATGLPLPQATLWMGQIANLGAILALYPLAARLGRSRWAGVVAALVGGLLSPMPMSYVNWGRYTELAGLAILPAAIFLAGAALGGLQAGWEAAAGRRRAEAPAEAVPAEASPAGLPALLPAWIALAGLALTHYRVAAFALLFFPAAWLFALRPARFGWMLRRTLALGAGAAGLFLPWFVRLFSGKLPQSFAEMVATPATGLSESTLQYNAIGNLSAYLPEALWLLLLVATLWALRRRERGALSVALWWLLILLAANPHWLGLPGAGVLSNFAVMIAAYFPAGLLLGAAAGWLMEAWEAGAGRATGEAGGAPLPEAAGVPLPSKGRRLSSPAWVGRAALLLVLALGSYGAWRRVKDVAVAQHALVTRPDLRAAAWIAANTPQTARFLVNSFPAYGDSLVVGSDAGWWLPLLARRENTLPPILYASERGPRPDYLAWTNALTFKIRELGILHPEIQELLRERQVTHLYVGQQQGQVNAGGPPLLPAEALLGDDRFRLVYRQDRVWVFEIVAP